MKGPPPGRHSGGNQTPTEARDIMYAAIDHHKAVFQTAMLDPHTGVAADERFEGSRDGLASWVERWQGRGDRRRPRGQHRLALDYTRARGSRHPGPSRR